MFHIIRNALDYPLRQVFRWRRGGLKIRNESKEGMFGSFREDNRINVEESADRVLSEYHLHELFHRSSVTYYLKNLYYLEMFEKGCASASCTLPDSVKAADVGASDWF